MTEVDTEGLLAAISSASGEAVLSLTPEGHVLWASPSTEVVTGWRPEELTGSHVSVLALDVLTGHQARDLEKLASAAAGPRPGAGTRRDGTAFEADVRLAAVRDSSGGTIGLTAVVRDVTEERSRQRELELSRARFEQSSTLQAVADLRGCLTSVNPAWCELFGQSEEFFVGRDLMSLVHPMHRVNAAAQLAPWRNGDAESASYESVFQDARGQNLILLLDVTLLRRPDGTRGAIAVFARDLTQVEAAQRRLAAQEGMYRALGRRSWDAAIVTDAELNMVYVCPSVVQMLGYEPAEILVIDAWDLVHPDDEPKVRKALDIVSSEPQRTEHLLVRIRHKLGSWRWIEKSLTNCLTDPHIGGLVANLRDVTEQVETERALRLSEARHRAMLETAHEGIMATAPDGGTLFANQKMAQILGLSLTQLYRQDARQLLRPDCDDGPGEPGPERDGTSYEATYAHPDGSERILTVSSSRWNSDDAESTAGLLFMVSDFTEIRRWEDQLRQRALQDPLTELSNRYLFLDRLEMAAARQLRAEVPSTAVLFLDLDGLKGVNDNHGHEAGDILLQQVASRLTSAVRASDTVGRLGGDEFAIISEGTSEDDAMLLASRIHDQLRQPVILAQGPVSVSVSIGVAVSPPVDFPDLLRLADIAMYRAKDLGGDRTVLFRPQEHHGSGPASLKEA